MGSVARFSSALRSLLALCAVAVVFPLMFGARKADAAPLAPSGDEGNACAQSDAAHGEGDTVLFVSCGGFF